MVVEVNLTYDGDPPSVVALRKALASVGPVSAITPVNPGTIRISFVEGTQISLDTPITVNGKPVSLAPTTVLHSRGTIYRRELALWTLEELQAELDSSIKVLRRLPTRNEPAENSGRILLGFTTNEPPADITIPLMGLKLSVNAYIPGATRCSRCHRYQHRENHCTRPARCGRCGSQSHKKEDCIANPCCPACKGPHEVNDTRCPTWLAEKQRIREAVTGVTTSSSSRAPNKAAATNTAPTRMDFPTLQGKRALTSPPTPPAPKRWAQPPLTDAPVGSPPELLRILENQTALLMQIMQLLQRLLTSSVPTIQPLPASAPQTLAQQTPSEPTTSSSANLTVGTSTTTTSSSAATTTDTPNRSPKTRRQKERQLLLTTDPAQTTGQPRILNLGRDTASPSASNIGTFDFKEK